MTQPVKPIGIATDTYQCKEVDPQTAKVDTYIHYTSTVLYSDGSVKQSNTANGAGWIEIKAAD
jgi:hypothetical protein